MTFIAENPLAHRASSPQGSVVPVAGAAFSGFTMDYDQLMCLSFPTPTILLLVQYVVDIRVLQKISEGKASVVRSGTEST